VEQAALDHVQQLIEDDIEARFPGGGIERVVVLQYGDDPAVEPGEMAVRVFVAAEGDHEERERVAVPLLSAPDREGDDAALALLVWRTRLGSVVLRCRSPQLHPRPLP